MRAAGGFVLDPPAMLRLGDRALDLTRRTLVIGVLNRTPDSFYQRHFDLDGALERADEIVAEGGDLIDVGGVKAGAGPDVGVQEEIDRVCPVIEAIRSHHGVDVSVDTFRAATARAALAAGAVLVNDISGLADPDMVATVVEAGASVVVAHIQGSPRVPHLEPVYGDVVTEVREELRGRLAEARAAGIAPDRLVADPGLDLGKSYPQSMVVLRELSAFCDLGCVILLSASHKGFLGAVAPLRVDERHEASMAALAYGVARGARLVRVHAVRAAARVCRTMEAFMTARADDPWVSRYEPNPPDEQESAGG